MQQFITTYFNQGYCGTWFTYFLSKHPGFFELPYEYKRENYSGGLAGWREEQTTGDNRYPQHMSLNSTYWYRPWAEDLRTRYDRDMDAPQLCNTWEEYLDFMESKGWQRNQRLSFKHYPHGCSILPTHPEDIAYHKTVGIIYLTAYRTDWVDRRNLANWSRYRNTSSHRKRFLKKIKEQPIGRAHSYPIAQWHKDPSYDLYECDILRILECNDDEYQKLCARWSITPLEDWKKTVRSYLKTIHLDIS